MNPKVRSVFISRLDNQVVTGGMTMISVTQSTCLGIGLIHTNANCLVNKRVSHLLADRYELQPKATIESAD